MVKTSSNALLFVFAASLVGAVACGDDTQTGGAGGTGGEGGTPATGGGGAGTAPLTACAE